MSELIKVFQNVVNEEFDKRAYLGLAQYFLIKYNIVGSNTIVTNPIDGETHECNMSNYFVSDWVYDTVELASEPIKKVQSATVVFSLVKHMSEMIKNTLFDTPYVAHLNGEITEKAMREIREALSMRNFPEDGDRLCLTTFDKIREIAVALGIEPADTFSWNGITFVPVSFKQVQMEESKPVLIFTHKKALIACFGSKIITSLNHHPERDGYLMTNEQTQGIKNFNPGLVYKVELQ